jgi:hypothetical protein
MSELPLDSDGFVDMEALPALDPEEALAEDVHDRLHEALVTEPVRVPTESQWDAMIETALGEPAGMEADWLVPPDAPVPGEVHEGPALGDFAVDVEPDVHGDTGWLDVGDAAHDPHDGADVDQADDVDGGQDLL